MAKSKSSIKSSKSSKSSKSNKSSKSSSKDSSNNKLNINSSSLRGVRPRAFKTKYTYNDMLVSFVIMLIINGYLIYYLDYLEKEECNCDIDWQHKYIKYFAVGIILNGLFSVLFFKNMQNIDNNNQLVILFKIIIALLCIVYVYLLFTYLGKLNDKKKTSEECNKCVTENLKNINNFFYYYRYFYLFTVIILPIIFLLLIFISLVMND